MAANKNKWISIMIVPEDGTGMKKWRLTASRFAMFKIGAWITGFFLFIGFASMITVAVMTYKLNYYKEFNGQLLESTAKLERIAVRLDRYREKERKLRAVLGSDLDLPEAMVVAPDNSLEGGRVVASSVAGNELEQAIAMEEKKIRHLPTQWPVDAWQITKKFQRTGNPRTDHYAIDILAADKSGVVAAGTGTVMSAGIDSEFGRLVIVDHGNLWETRYGHLESIVVKPGDIIGKGSILGVYGESEGTSTGIHLHFGMSYGGRPVDPLKWLEEKPILNLAKNK